MKLINTAIIGLALNTYSIAIAGNSSSGGGFLYDDELNPWFLENTSVVSYCYEIDSSKISLPEKQIDSIIIAAIKNWQTALVSSRSLNSVNGAKLGTQRFVKKTCSDKTRLKFQFGFLSEEQKENYIPDVDHTLARAVRTSYDEKNLVGIGFIYIASDTATDKLSSLKITPNSWSYFDGVILQRVLTHELGHVFGVNHSGTAFDLMGEGHPEFLVMKSTIEDLSRQDQSLVTSRLRRIDILDFSFPYEQISCRRPDEIDLGIGHEAYEFFGIDKSFECIKLVFHKDSLDVYASLNLDSDYKLIGSAKDMKSIQFSKTTSRVKLNPKQVVFKKLSSLEEQTNYKDCQSSLIRTVLNGEYKSLDGKRAGGISISYYPNQKYDLEVVLKNKIVQLMLYGG